MRFVFGKQDMTTLERAQENCWLLTNGLGGFMSASAAFSVTRCDQAILMAAVTAPNERMNLVHRLSEQLTMGKKSTFFSTQSFADGRVPEEGYRNLSSFVWDNGPAWTYHVDGVRVRRRCAMEYGSNTAAAVYEIENRSDVPCTLRVRPFCLFAPKGERAKAAPVWSNGALHGGGYTVSVHTNGTVKSILITWETLAYPDDARDERIAEGPAAACCVVERTIQPGEIGRTLEIVFSLDETRKSGTSPPNSWPGARMLSSPAGTPPGA